MHYVSRIDPAAAQVPRLFERHSLGFRRCTYVDRAMGSVHMGVGVCYLAPEGAIDPHVHSFEESFYVLEGEAIARIGDSSYRFGPGHYGLIGTGVPHG